MRIRWTVNAVGPTPKRIGVEVDLPDDQAKHECEIGHAVPVRKKREKAVPAAPEVETRGD